jgi:hypothetical protein
VARAVASAEPASATAHRASSAARTTGCAMRASATGAARPA